MEIRKTHVRQSGNGIIFTIALMEIKDLMSNIGRTVTDNDDGVNGSCEYETAPALSIGTMILEDLELS